MDDSLFQTDDMVVSSAFLSVTVLIGAKNGTGPRMDP
jgi:hypothetical protein